MRWAAHRLAPVSTAATLAVVTTFALSCSSKTPGGAEAGAPGLDAPPDSSPDPTDSTADAGPECVPPVQGAACTADQVPCIACCIDGWECQEGVWHYRIVGCLPSAIPCGNLNCLEGSGAYCEISSSDNGPTEYACKALPSICAGTRCPTCDCLKQAGISFSQCLTNWGGALRLVK